MLLEISVNEEMMEEPFGTLRSGDKISVSLPADVIAKQGGFYTFETKLADFECDLDAIERLRGQSVDLGHLPSLTREAAESASIITKANMLYDTLLIYDGHMMDPSRFSTGSEFPNRLSLDEVKYMIVRRAGMTLAEAKGASAEVLYDPSGIGKTGNTHGLKIGNGIVTVMSNELFGLQYVGTTPAGIAGRIRQA